MKAVRSGALRAAAAVVRRNATVPAIVVRHACRAWLAPVTAPVRAFSAGPLPPFTRMTMPALSPTMTAGTIVKWHKHPGDALNPGDLVAEVATDKATVDFECQDSGYLAQILVPEGTTDVTVGKLIAIMVDTPDAVAAFATATADTFTASSAAPPAPGGGAAAAAPAAAPAPAAAAPAPASATAAAPAAAASAGGRVVASPLAKKLAADAGVPLTALAAAGTGPGGRVIAADVKDFIASGGAASAAAAKASAAAAAVAAPAPAAAAAPAAAPAAAVASGPYTDIPHTQMRRVIAHRLTLSKQTVPHYTLTAEVTMDAVLALRAKLNADLGEGTGKLSVNDFLIKASALALRKVPEMNSSWLDHGIRAYDYVDVSVAVAIPDGLITPIVKDADKKGLLGISTSVKGLVDKAKARKLQPDEFQGGTFTISNLGMFGIKQFSAIINPPQAGILAVGATEKRIVPDTAADAKAPFKQAVVMTATLSCDHRVVDGAVGAQWLAVFKGYLENPTTMLL